MLDEPDVRCRPAIARDSSDLAILADAATRRLISWLWDTTALVGQSSFEVGREAIRTNEHSVNHFSRWRVAERNASTVGAVNGYVMTPDRSPPNPVTANVVAPLNELKVVAAGSWYVSIASVFPEARGQGVGKALLADAETLATAAGATSVTLLVASFNPSAKRLYERLGFRERTRRPFAAFPGSGEAGDWILMVNELG